MRGVMKATTPARKEKGKGGETSLITRDPERATWPRRDKGGEKNEREKGIVISF